MAGAAGGEAVEFADPPELMAGAASYLVVQRRLEDARTEGARMDAGKLANEVPGLAPFAKGFALLHNSMFLSSEQLGSTS
jgi:hypothetical protein